ncbi:hypothetical protein ODS41_12645 [Pyrobaculum sp. 3827-6]|uniref:hypothetical protein n=1 Tax=Pyrobaculum sp. 3827-6 TaxID=2983604 RepID=UPI0021D92F4D|nr:hypothetical protein [Pyrobaculum sp. 3827-6]MCU7788762.1 hypothetical protein [Pyrobaculum sp. 3827-6]
MALQYIHLDTSTIVEGDILNRLISSHLMKSGRFKIRISPYVLAELSALASRRREKRVVLDDVISYIESGDIELYIIKRENFDDFCQYVDSLRGWLQWMGPSDVFILASAMSDSECRYFITSDRVMLENRDQLVNIVSKRSFDIVESLDEIKRLRNRRT